MPRTPINYDNACIYQFEKEGIVYYVGSTTNFTNRKSQHRCNTINPNNKKHNLPIYIFIRANGGWDAFKMILIENYKCNDVNELTAREQHFINEFRPTLLNVNNPVGISFKQYYIENQEKIKKKVAKYRLENKEAVEKAKREYCLKNKEAIAKQKTLYYNNNKDKFVQYRIDNQEAIAKRKVKYRLDNREAINKRKRELYRAKHPIIEK